MLQTRPDSRLQNKLDPRDGDEKGKLFVGGLSWDTCNESLLKYFMRYGEVIDCVVMKNPTTGKSRGFGFIKFRDSSVLDVVLASAPHVIDGRQVDPKACNPRSMNKASQGGKSTEKNRNKIFMGGLPTNSTEEQVKAVFEQFGTVTDLVIMFDQEKQKSRGFGFLSYESEESVARVCQQQYVEVAGKKVECKRAEPRDPKVLAAISSAGMVMTAGGLMPASALGLPSMPMGGNGLIPASLPGVTLMPVSPGFMHPLTQLNTGGMASPLGAASPGSLPSAWAPASMAAAETEGWTPVSSPTQYSSAAAISSSALNGSGSYGNAVLGVETTQGSPDRVPVPAAYLSPSSYSSPPSAQSLNMGETIPEGKGGYIVYNNPALGMFGNYPQEPSSYGPARMLAPDMKFHQPMGLMSPYSGSFTYAASPGLAPLQSAYGPIAGFGGLVPIGYGGHGDAPAYAATALSTRALTAAQGFHPYRRADDTR